MAIKTRKKLIEVALPLDAINKASAREKSIRHGHPSTLHLWWARRPLAAARAVIFAQMVDDPSEYTETLLSDPIKQRAAKQALAKRLEVWTRRKVTHEDACRQCDPTVPAPGPEPTLEGCIADIERERLFDIIRNLVLWENTTNEEVLNQARDEIWKSWRATCADNKDHPQAAELFNPDKLPAFHDPFVGGGSLPLEAQRLGLEAYASDLNPVAVLINKAMIEIPPKFAGRPPVNPDARKGQTRFDETWRGAKGLAEDVRYYGKWMRDEAEKRIGHLYPKIEITEAMLGRREDIAPLVGTRVTMTEELAKDRADLELLIGKEVLVTEAMSMDRPDLKPYVGQKLTVIAWLWARTVKSPNPAFAHVDVPLISNFMLSTKPGKEAYVEPAVEAGSAGVLPAYSFKVRVGKPKDPETAKNGTKLSRGANFRCVMSGTPVDGNYIRTEGKTGRLGARLMTIVAEGQRGRVYLSPTPEHETVAVQAKPEWKPEGAFVEDARAFTPCIFGITEWQHLFTDRQLVTLTTFSDLVQDARERVQHDALTAGIPDDAKQLRGNGTAATAYAESVAVYLGIAVARYSNASTTICSWNPGQKKEDIRFTFSRQALPMTWDYAEGNPFSASSGNYSDNIETWLYKALLFLPNEALLGASIQADAASQSILKGRVVSTDPPYYDNVPYADLSDFFYVWLRRSLRHVFPELFATLAVPKAEELVAFAYRHTEGKAGAEVFFVEGMTQAMHRLAEQAHPTFPVTVYYAFKQAESGTEAGTASTGWETFLDAANRSGFAVTGTWPMRTEREGRSRGINSNALASSIVLVCRKRDEGALTVTRREFLSALKAELPLALIHLQRGNIAPVDLAQAAIGPGMAVYTRFAKVLDAEGKPLSVREALALINQTLDEVLAEQEGDFDAGSRWALAWFEQFGFAEGEYGVAEQLSKSKNTSVAGMVDAGILTSKAGKVRLLKPAEMPDKWDPAGDKRINAWEILHHLIRVLEAVNEEAAAELAKKLGSRAEAARELAYRLYTLCERKKRAAEALSYNGLVQSWPEIMRLAGEAGAVQQKRQAKLFQ